MKEKASVLMISLWILAILVVFATSLGHRALIDLRLSRYQRDRLKAYYLAKSGVNKAITKIQKGNLKEQDKEEIFINGDAAFTIQDEQSKLNINALDKIQLEKLIVLKANAAEAQDLATLIAEWISSADESQQDAEKRVFKNAPLEAPEELLVVLEYFYKDQGRARETFNKIKDSITVWGDKAININTAAEETLSILLVTVAEGLSIGRPSEKEIGELIEEISKERKNGPFLKTPDWEDRLGISSPGPKRNVFAAIKSRLIPQSQLFHIFSEGTVSRSAVKVKIDCVFDLKGNNFLYWRQN